MLLQAHLANLRRRLIMFQNPLFSLYRNYSKILTIIIAAVIAVFLGAFSVSNARVGRIEAVRSKPATPAATPSALPDRIAEPPAYKATAVPFRDGEKLVFQASWAGIPVATARVELHSKKKTPDRWSAEAWVETTKFADVFFKMRDYMSEDLDHRSLISHEMYIRQHENKRLNDFKADFDRQDGIVTLTKRNHRGQQVKRFISSNPFGPISGAMMALSMPMAPGQHYAFDVFTGSTRYIFDLKVGPRAKITTPLGTFDAYPVTPAVDYESDGKLSESATGTVIWVSADERRLPLRAESQAFFGTVRADLVQASG
jgi:hypothetical protein